MIRELRRWNWGLIVLLLADLAVWAFVGYEIARYT